MLYYRVCDIPSGFMLVVHDHEQARLYVLGFAMTSESVIAHHTIECNIHDQIEYDFFEPMMKLIYRNQYVL